MLTILRNLNFKFYAGASYAIIGVSGAGKTTLLNLLAGLETPSSGQVLLSDQTVSFQHLRQAIAIVSQQPLLLSELTVWENVALKGLIAGQSKKVVQAAALCLLTQVGLVACANYQISQLSGGEQQRVAVARALWGRPQFLLADEPTGNLDQQTGQALVKLLIQLQKELKVGLIVATHDNYVAQSLETKLYLQQGQLRTYAAQNEYE